MISFIEILEELFDKTKKKADEIKNQHLVKVYDADDNTVLEETMQPLNVTHMVRYRHDYGNNNITYSFNTHYNNGLIMYGMVPDPGFPGLNWNKEDFYNS